MEKLNLKLIRTDGGTQSRAEINNDAVKEYAEAINAGATFPPVLVFYDSCDYWLADGFHRYHAHVAAGKASIPAETRLGSQHDAIWYSVSDECNGKHGLRQSNADKRKKVAAALAHPNSASLSDNAIAKHVGVSHTFVASVRAAILHPLQDSPIVRTVSRNGRTYEQDTSKIGRIAEVRTQAQLDKSVARIQAEDNAERRRQIADLQNDLTDERPADDGPSADEIRAGEMAAAADAQAIEKLLESDDKLTAAYTEIKRLNAEVATLKVARDGYMNQASELIRMVKSLQAKLKKAEVSQ